MINKIAILIKKEYFLCTINDFKTLFRCVMSIAVVITISERSTIAITFTIIIELIKYKVHYLIWNQLIMSLILDSFDF